MSLFTNVPLQRTINIHSLDIFAKEKMVTYRLKNKYSEETYLVILVLKQSSRATTHYMDRQTELVWEVH